MTSVWKRVGLGLVLVAAASVSASAAIQPARQPRPPRRPRRSTRPRPRPPYIRDRIDELGRGFDGRVGIAVRVDRRRLVDRLEGRRALSAAERQQIVGVDHRARRGRQGQGLARRPGHADPRRPDPVPPADRGADPRRRNYTTTLGDLMVKAITTSDNTANDKLMRSVGGPEAVRAMIARQASGRDPLLQWRARAAEPDRRPDLEPELFDRQRLLRGARRACR